MLKIDNSIKKPKVSVVIPAYNEELLLGSTIDSLMEQDYPEPIELVICDNASTDKTTEVAQSKGARVVYEERKGTRFAYDRGMKESKGELILVTNADVRLPKNWISSIVQTYEDNPEVVGVGTRARFYGCPSWVNGLFNVMEGLSPKRSFWGTSMSTRRWAYEKVGGFNHGVNTNEDGIFGLLLEKIGKIKILDDVTVMMDGRRFNGGIISTIKEWGKGIGLNAIYIQINYFLSGGQIKTLVKDFGDVRSSVFGQGEDAQISVVIPTANDQAQLAQVLTDLQNQYFQHTYRVYVLDNFSVDLSLQIAKAFPYVTVATYPGVYDFGNRLRKLLGEIESPVIAFTSPNAHLPTDWLHNIYHEFNKKRKKQIEVLTGPYIHSGTKLVSTVTNQPIERVSEKIQFQNFAIRKETASKIMNHAGSLEEVARHTAAEVMKQKVPVHYSGNFKATFSDSSLLSSIISSSTDSIRHSLKKLMQPVMGEG